MQGVGKNPYDGHTNFDDMGSSSLNACQLLSLDWWESLYRSTLESAGPASLLFFAPAIFVVGHYFLQALYLGIVAMSYDYLMRCEQDVDERETKELERLRSGGNPDRSSGPGDHSDRSG